MYFGLFLSTSPKEGMLGKKSSQKSKNQSMKKHWTDLYLSAPPINTSAPVKSYRAWTKLCNYIKMFLIKAFLSNLSRFFQMFLFCNVKHPKSPKQQLKI